jgi:hypothetical protein
MAYDEALAERIRNALRKSGLLNSYSQRRTRAL